jgi:hypothetical protein
MEAVRIATLWVIQEGYALHYGAKQQEAPAEAPATPPAEGANDIPF